MSISGAIIGHMVGDYLLQNDWMAAGKKRDWRICLLHASIWTTVVCLFADLSTWDTPVIPFLLVAHFFQDHTNFVKWWMGLVGQKYFRDGPHAPWSEIVVDNTLHLLAIFIALSIFRT